MNEVKYCPAYLLNSQEFDSAEACLDARGCSEAQAQTLIAHAKAQQAEIVLPTAAEPPHDFFLVIAEHGSKWRTWAGRADAGRDQHGEAAQLMETFGKDVEWRIFNVRAGDIRTGTAPAA